MSLDTLNSMTRVNYEGEAGWLLAENIIQDFVTKEEGEMNIGR